MLPLQPVIISIMYFFAYFHRLRFATDDWLESFNDEINLEHSENGHIAWKYEYLDLLTEHHRCVSRCYIWPEYREHVWETWYCCAQVCRWSTHIPLMLLVASFSASYIEVDRILWALSKVVIRSEL